MSSKLYQNFIKELKQAGSLERARHDQKYHRSGYKHLGVPTPANDATIKKLTRGLPTTTLLKLADELWQSGIWDAMISAGRILALRSIPPDAQVWRRIKSYMPACDGWALADNLRKAAARCLVADPRRLQDLEAWSKHRNFWFRRAALVFTLHHCKPGQDIEPMLRWMEQYADDPEWFIQKAIGWWLRELGKYQLDPVLNFLNAHGHLLQRVARHEATRRLTPAQCSRITAF